MAEGFRAATSNESVSNGTDITVTIDPSIQANDGLIATYTVASTTATVATPSGWTLKAGPIDKGTVLRTYVFEKYASGADAGSTLTVTKSVADASKRQITVAAYSGVDQTDFIQDFASFVETTAGTSHSIPTVTAVGSGNWRAAFVVDRGSPASTGFTPPASLPSERSEFIGSGTGTCSTDWVDSGAAVSAGAYSGDSITGTVSTANAITLAFVIKAAGATNATPTPGVLNATVSFHTPTILNGSAVQVNPDVLRMSTTFYPVVGAGTAQVTPDLLTASVTFFSPTISAQATALTIPDPIAMSVTFFAPTVTTDGPAPPPGQTPPDTSSGLFRFRSPTRVESWPIAANERLAVKVEINLTMYRINGVWHAGTNLTYVDLQGADRIYYGGYQVDVPDSELSEMVAQGFDVLEPIDTSTDEFLDVFTDIFPGTPVDVFSDPFMESFT